MCSFLVLQEQRPGGLQSSKVQAGYVPACSLFFSTSQKVYGFFCTSEVCRMLLSNSEGCWYSEVKSDGFVSVEDALIPSCLAGKFIVKMMLSILCFLKDHHFFAYFWSSCLPGFMVITCSVGFFVRTLVALKLTVNSLPCHISD